MFTVINRRRTQKMKMSSRVGLQELCAITLFVRQSLQNCESKRPIGDVNLNNTFFILRFMKIIYNIKALETAEVFWEFFPILNDIYNPGAPGGRTQVGVSVSAGALESGQSVFTDQTWAGLKRKQGISW